MIAGLREVLETLKGATMITLEAVTQPEFRTKKLPSNLIGVKKYSRVNGVIGFAYQNSVNNRREKEDKEPDFTSIPRSWGERLWNTCLVKHHDKYYLEVKVERLLSMEYRDENGQIIPKKDLEDYLRQRKTESSRQKIDKEVILRDYSLENITSLTINGAVYR